MATQSDAVETRARRRRWLLGLDPIVEASRSGRRAGDWDAEDELIAVALIGDVTIDLSRARSTPEQVTIEAYAILRDVEVLVSKDTQVELGGGTVWGDLSDEAPAVSADERQTLVRVHAHALAGDVTVRTGTA